MATWTNQNTVLTDAGRNLLSYAQAGNGGLTITKVVPGAGRCADAALATQVAVTTPKPQMTVNSTKSDETGTVLTVQLNNKGLAEAYELNQIGIYASNPNTGEVLYLISQCVSGTSDTIPLPSQTPTILNFSFVLIHGAEAEVAVTVGNTGLVSAEIFNEHRHNNATVTVDGFMSSTDKSAHNTVVGRVNQDLKTTASPTFASAVIGAVTIASDGTITGAKFT